MEEKKDKLQKEKTKFNELNNKYIDICDKFKILEEKNNKLDEELKSKIKLLKKYDEEKNTLKHSKEFFNNNNINNSNDSLLLSKYNKLKEDYESLNDINEKNISELKKAKEESLEAKKNYKILNDEKVKLKADILEMKADFKMDKNHYEKKIANLEKQISTKNNLIEEIKNNNKDTENENDLMIINLKIKNKEIQNQNVLLKEDLKRQNDEIENLNQKINELNNNKNSKNSFEDNKQINNLEKNVNYDYVKCYQLTDNLKWYLIKKEEKIEETLKINKIRNNIYINSDYDSFIWISEENLKQLGIDDLRKYSMDKDIEKSPKILEGKINIKFNFKNYNQNNDKNNKKLLETLEKLKNENKYLNQKISKLKIKMNTKDISIIEDESDNSIFTEEDFSEDFNEGNNNNNVNNIYNIHNNNNNMKIYLGSGKNSYYVNQAINNDKNLNLIKDSINSLMAQIRQPKKAKGTIGVILKQLGCSNDEICKLLESKE